VLSESNFGGVQGVFVNFLIVFFFARKLVKIHLDFDWEYWKKIMKIAAPLAFSLIFTLIHFKIDTVLLSILKPPEDVGIYGAAYKILEGLITFAAIFAGLLLPILSRYAFTEKERFAKVYRKGFDVLSIFVIPLIFGTLFFAKPLMLLFGGGEFEISSQVLKILIFAVAAIFFAHLFGNTVVAVNQQKKMMWAYLAAAVSSIIINIILIPRYSYFGAATTTLITETLVALFTAYIVFRTAKVAPQWRVFFKALLSALVMSGVIFFLPDWHYAINIGIAMVVYFAFLYLIKGFSKEDVVEILRVRS
jgi:O-antigen/teichoic acid export membrane protein